MFQLRQNSNDISEPVPFKFIEKIADTKDTYKLKFEIPDNLTLGLNLGYHLEIVEIVKSAEHPEGELIGRKYTPISYFKDRGSFVLLVKIYYSDVNPKFPEGGKLTQHLDSIVPGDFINICGPTWYFNYLGNGFCRLKELLFKK